MPQFGEQTETRRRRERRTENTTRTEGTTNADGAAPIGNAALIGIMQNGVPEHQGRGRDDTRDRVLERVASRGLIGGPQGAGNENAGDPQGAENENAMTPFGHAKEAKNENDFWDSFDSIVFALSDTESDEPKQVESLEEDYKFLKIDCWEEVTAKAREMAYNSIKNAVNSIENQKWDYKDIKGFATSTQDLVDDRPYYTRASLNALRQTGNKRYARLFLRKLDSVAHKYVKKTLRNNPEKLNQVETTDMSERLLKLREGQNLDAKKLAEWKAHKASIMAKKQAIRDEAAARGKRSELWSYWEKAKNIDNLNELYEHYAAKGLDLYSLWREALINCVSVGVGCDAGILLRMRVRDQIKMNGGKGTLSELDCLKAVLKDDSVLTETIQYMLKNADANKAFRVYLNQLAEAKLNRKKTR